MVRCCVIIMALWERLCIAGKFMFLFMPIRLKLMSSLPFIKGKFPFILAVLTTIYYCSVVFGGISLALYGVNVCVNIAIC